MQNDAPSTSCQLISNQPKAPQNTNKLIKKEKVDFLVGPVHSGIAAAMAKIMGQRKSPIMIVPNAGSNDVTGPLRNIGFHGSYSYHIKVNDNSKLAMGLSVSLTQHVLDRSEFILNNDNDLVLNGGKQRSLNPDGSFGIYYFGDRYFAGI